MEPYGHKGEGMGASQSHDIKRGTVGKKKTWLIYCKCSVTMHRPLKNKIESLWVNLLNLVFRFNDLWINGSFELAIFNDLLGPMYVNSVSVLKYLNSK